MPGETRAGGFPRKGRPAPHRVPATGVLGQLAVSAAGRADQRGLIITAGNRILDRVSGEEY